MNREITLYESRGSPCPYIQGREWTTRFFLEDSFPGALYEQLLSRGFRRSGNHFYHNICPGCAECSQIRIPSALFRPSGSQRRVLRKNRDVDVTLEPAVFRRDVYELYRRYCESRHEKEGNSEEDFIRFLCHSPLDTRAMLYRIDGILAGVGWVDFLPGGLSSVYYAYEPEFSSRSLGTYSVLKEIELVRSLGLDWYYLGFVVDGSPKMRYKAAFRPHQRLRGGVWTDYP